jgi:hypothetical protein
MQLQYSKEPRFHGTIAQKIDVVIDTSVKTQNHRILNNIDL